MLNIDIQKVQDVIGKGEKIVLTKLLPFALSTVVVASVNTKAQAKEVQFNEVSLEDNSIDEDFYTSRDLNAKEYDIVIQQMQQINGYFENFYTILANRGLSRELTGSKTNSMTRFWAHMNEIKAMMNYDMQDENGNLKRICARYLNSKINEAKVLYSELVNISVDKLEKYGEEYTCMFTNEYTPTSREAMVYQTVDGKIEVEEYVTFEDKGIEPIYTVINIPKAKITMKNGKVNETITYQAKLVEKEKYSSLEQMIQTIDELYNKIETAYEKGQYSIDKTYSYQDTYVAIYGDMNTVDNRILNQYQISDIVRQYIEYRKTGLLYKVAQSGKLDYSDMVKFGREVTSTREKDADGRIYYTLKRNGYSNLTYSVSDKGYLPISEIALKTATSTLKSETIQVKTGVNIFLSDIPFFPKNASGNAVKPFIYNGTTYLPARALANAFGADIRYDSKTKSVYITKNEDHDYTVDYGTGTISKQYNYEKITVSTGMRVYYNGEEIIPTNVNGKIVPILYYNGTTYLPVRALANIFGANVRFDTATKGVYITKTYQYSSPSDSFIIAQDIKTGQWVNIYIDGNSYYILQNNQRRYLANLNGYLIDGEPIYQKTR